jgi:hypothetical protein
VKTSRKKNDFLSKSWRHYSTVFKHSAAEPVSQILVWFSSLCRWSVLFLLPFWIFFRACFLRLQNKVSGSQLLVLQLLDLPIIPFIISSLIQPFFPFETHISHTLDILDSPCLFLLPPVVSDILLYFLQTAFTFSSSSSVLVAQGCCKNLPQILWLKTTEWNSAHNIF